MLFSSWKVKSKGLGEEKLLWKTIYFRISIFIFDLKKKKKDGFTFNFVSYLFLLFIPFALPSLFFYYYSLSS